MSAQEVAQPTHWYVGTWDTGTQWGQEGVGHRRTGTWGVGWWVYGVTWDWGGVGQEVTGLWVTGVGGPVAMGDQGLVAMEW